MSEGSVRSEPIFTISGVRGVVGRTFTARTALEISASFGAWLGKGRVAVGRDTRATGEMVVAAVSAGLTSVGCDVLDLGVVPSPKAVFAVKHLGAAGGIIVTASHNPPDWNGLKLVGPNGLPLSERELFRVREDWRSEAVKPVASERVGRVLPGRLSGRYEKSVTECVDAQALTRTGLKVAVDPGNGAGSFVTPYVLQQLGCKLTAINAVPDGAFPRPIEPTEEALAGLVEVVKAEGADVGFAHDCDADRLVCVDEKGEVLPEDFTLAVVVDSYLEANPGSAFVTNVASSSLFEEIAERHGSRVYRSRVGESFVVQKMIEVGAPIGGEGSCGGVILPRLSYTRDGILAAAKVLEVLATRGETLSAITGRMPRYFSVRTKLPCSREEAQQVVTALAERHRGETIDLTDGFKLLKRGEWVLVRPSGTEPVLRIMSEARTQESAKRLNDETRKYVEDILAGLR
ncbi:MAG: phosphoglucosamine mutase [Candidatus Bathyarchaeia archaeon]